MERGGRTHPISALVGEIGGGRGDTAFLHLFSTTIPFLFFWREIGKGRRGPSDSWQIFCTFFLFFSSIS